MTTIIYLLFNVYAVGLLVYVVCSWVTHPKATDIKHWLQVTIVKRFPIRLRRWIVAVLLLSFAATARANSEAEGAAFVLKLGIVYLLLVLIPFFVAKSRKHIHKRAIFWLNLFFGWTLFFWVIMLVWAIIGQSNREYKLCVKCRERIKADAKLCVYCGSEQRGSTSPSPGGWPAPSSPSPGGWPAPSPPTGTTTISPSPPPTAAVPPTTVATHRTGTPTVTKNKAAKKKVVAKAVEATPTPSTTSVEKSIPPVDIGPTCPNCGSPGWDVTGACGICGHSENRNLSLVTKDGVVISMGVLTVRLNQDWAKQKLGEDGIFWDKNWQFSLERRNQDWVLIPNSAPTNDTLVDGVAVTTEMVLSDGILLSVGNQAKGIQKTPLTVRLG